MTKFNRGSRLGACCAVLCAYFFGLAGSAMGWVTSPADYPDVKVFAGVQSQGARVAFDPSNPNRLIAGKVARDKCVIKSSADGGKTWGAAVPLPQLPDATCWHYLQPAVAYAADGSRVYAAYTYRRWPDFAFGVAFSISTDHGATWSPPTAIDSIEVGESQYSVELATAPDADWIYVIVNCECYFGTNIYFTSSPDLGTTWTPPKFIAWGSADLPVTAASLAAGPMGDVLISYAANRYYERTVEVLNSSDYGNSFVGGVADQERSLFFGYPNVRIDVFGTAHIVYSRGASDSGFTTDLSAILYKYSLRPYEMWSPRPARLDDGVPGAKLGLPRLAVGACENTSVVHVTWVQSLNGTEQVLYTRRIAEPEFHWSDPLKVSQTKRLIQTLDLAGTGANAFSTFSYWFESPVFGTRVWSGIICR